MFDDPRYTRPNMSSGIGALLSNIAAGKQNNRRMNLAEKQVSYQDPNRTPGIMDLLETAKSIYNSQQLYSGFPGYSPAGFDPAKFQSVLSGLQGILGNGRVAPGGSPMAPQAPAASPASPTPPSGPSSSILDKYLQADEVPSAPSAPAPSSSGASQPRPPSVIRKTDYSSLWRD